jgi:hypothetical protein
VDQLYFRTRNWQMTTRSSFSGENAAKKNIYRQSFRNIAINIMTNKGKIDQWTFD